MPAEDANGVIIAQVANLAAGLYAKKGKLKYCYNLFGVQLFTTESTSQLPSGKHQLRMEFEYEGGGLAKGGMSHSTLTGRKVGEGQVAAQPMIFSGMRHVMSDTKPAHR